MSSDGLQHAQTAAGSTFNSILIVCDANAKEQDALVLVCDLARSHDATLTVLSVIDHGDSLADLARHVGLAQEQIETAMRDETVRALSDLCEDFAGIVPIEYCVRFGRPFREIIGQVIEASHDLVVKQAEAFDDKHRFLFTSTDQHLIRKCPCPVWLMQPGHADPGKVILAAVDLDETGDGEPDNQLGLNRAIVGHAIKIAAFSGATLHVSHVWDAPAEDLVRRWASDSGGATAYIKSHEHKRRDALADLIAYARNAAGETAANLTIIPHLGRGLPRQVIPTQVEAMGAGLLVMGTIARTGIPGLIIGNTAEDVLNAVECPVLTIKPPGYVSPLDPHHA